MGAAGEYALRLLFPPRCLFCGDILPTVSGPVCGRCAKDFKRLRRSSPSAGFEALLSLEGAPDGVCASFLYERPASDVVARFKFRSQSWLAGDLARFVAADFERCFGGRGCSLALPVPSSKRGSDHALLLAKQVARLLRLPLERNALRKIKKTARQHELSAAERRENLLGAFAANGRLVRGRTLLLVDDVTTSGSTLLECSRALKAAGARGVCAACFCCTELLETNGTHSL